MIEISVAHRLGAFTLDAEFRAEGRLTALFGRSGAGKTSLIDVIAGLSTPARGRVVVDGTPLLDTARGLNLPPHRRRIGCVFQEARLMPHLSVRQNLALGRWFTPKGERREDMDAVVAMLGIGDLLGRRPAKLSGGEKQRVAIGRALMASPRLLLMDEPLAALDDARKAEILPYIERLRDEAGIPIIYVSHALAEVARLAGTVVVLDAGRVAATGPAAEILRRSDLFPSRGAEEAATLLELVVTGHDAANALTRLSGPVGGLSVPQIARPPGARVRILVRARDVLVATQRPAGLSARNILEGSLLRLREAGAGAVVAEIDCAGTILLARLTHLSARELDLSPGRAVFAVIKSVAFEPDAIGAGPAVEI